MTQAASNGWQQAIYQNTKALGGLEAQVKDLKVDVKEIKSKINTIDTKVSNIETEVSGLKQDLCEVKGDLSGIKGRLGEIEKLLKWLKWIAGGVFTIALALIANLISSLIIH